MSHTPTHTASYAARVLISSNARPSASAQAANPDPLCRCNEDEI